MFLEFCHSLVENDVFSFKNKYLQGNLNKYASLVGSYPEYKNHKFVNLRKKITPEAKQPYLGRPCIGYGLVNQFTKGDDKIVKNSYFINLDPREPGSGIKNKGLGILIVKEQLDFLKFQFDLCHTEESSNSGLKFVVMVEGKPSDNFCINLRELKTPDEFKEHIAFFLLHV